jgi:hypothetical protein
VPVYLACCLDRCQNRTVAFSRNTIHLPHEGVNYWRDPAKATIRIIRHNNCVSLATGIDGHLSFILYVMRFFNVLLVQGFANVVR